MDIELKVVEELNNIYNRTYAISVYLGDKRDNEKREIPASPIKECLDIIEDIKPRLKYIEQEVQKLGKS